MIFSFFASGIEGFGPRPGASSKPARPWLANRRSQRITAGRLMPTSVAVASWLRPSARSKTIRARATMRCGVVEALIMRSNSRRCPPLMSKTSIGRPMSKRKSTQLRYVTSIMRHYTRDLKYSRNGGCRPRSSWIHGERSKCNKGTSEISDEAAARFLARCGWQSSRSEFPADARTIRTRLSERCR